MDYIDDFKEFSKTKKENKKYNGHTVRKSNYSYYDDNDFNGKFLNKLNYIKKSPYDLYTYQYFVTELDYIFNNSHVFDYHGKIRITKNNYYKLLMHYLESNNIAYIINEFSFYKCIIRFKIPVIGYFCEKQIENSCVSHNICKKSYVLYNGCQYNANCFYKRIVINNKKILKKINVNLDNIYLKNMKKIKIKKYNYSVSKNMDITTLNHPITYNSKHTNINDKIYKLDIILHKPTIITNIIKHGEQLQCDIFPIPANTTNFIPQIKILHDDDNNLAWTQSISILYKHHKTNKWINAGIYNTKCDIFSFSNILLNEPIFTSHIRIIPIKYHLKPIFSCYVFSSIDNIELTNNTTNNYDTIEYELSYTFRNPNTKYILDGYKSSKCYYNYMKYNGHYDSYYQFKYKKNNARDLLNYEENL